MATPNVIQILRQAGFKGDALKTAYGIVMRESGGRADAYNPNRSTGDDSYGWFQVNMLGDLGPARRQQYGLKSNKDLLDPLTNAKVAYRMSKGGTDFGAWGIGPNAYRSGAGYDTIKKFVDQFPGSVKDLQGFQLPNAKPAPALKRSEFFADALKQGRWSLDSSLAETASLTREFNRTFARKPVPGHPEGKRFPAVRGKVSSVGAPIVQEAFKWLGTPYSWAGGGTGGPSKGVGRGANTVGFDCIASWVEVETDRGPVPIRDIRPGDRVLTRKGYRRVLAAWKVRDNAPVFRIEMSNGAVVVATADHRVWTTNRGWIPLSTADASDTLITCPSHMLSSSSGYATTGTRTLLARLIGVISSVREGRCTGLFGSITTAGRFRPATRFTIATETPSTTASTISSWSRWESTGVSRPRRGSPATTGAHIAVDGSRPSECRVLHADSVAGSASRPAVGRRAKTWASSCVRGAARLVAPGRSEPRNTARTVALRPLTGATPAGTADVYDLTVEGEHEFFAGGVLVHNCSGFLQYLWGKQGIQIPRVTYDQWRTGRAVGQGELQPGDAVFFRMGDRGPEHVGMYIGDGKFIQAPRTGDVIKISSLKERSDYVGARRYG